MVRWALAVILVGCGAPERSPSHHVRPDLALCEGFAERAHGPFNRPYEFRWLKVDANLDPIESVRATDEALHEKIDHTLWFRDDAGNLVEQHSDTDGDGHVDTVDRWTHLDDGRVQTWESWDRYGRPAGAEVYLHTQRRTELRRVLRDLDGDWVIDEIDEYVWDTNDRLIQLDTWDPEGPEPIARTLNEYFEPAPRMDRLERIDTDGDNVQDDGVIYAYAPNGSLERTEDREGTITTYAWDDDGRLLASLAIGPTWAVTWEGTYTELGLPATTRQDVDLDLDGVIDTQEVVEWTWSCGGEAL